MQYTIHVAYDDAAKVWYVESTNVQGLSAEATSFEGLIEILPGMVADMVDENHLPEPTSIEVTASSWETER